MYGTDTGSHSTFFQNKFFSSYLKAIKSYNLNNHSALKRGN